MAAARHTAQNLGLFASLAALAAGGVALGMEVERRVVSRRLRPPAAEPTEDFFGLRSDGPMVTTPDGVVLHTEVDESETDEPGLTLVLVHGYALNMDCWHFQRKHFRGRIRQVFYDQRSHGRSGRSAPEKCRIGVLSADLLQVLDEVAGEGPVLLVGHSMGGMTIMNLALTRPELFGTRIRGVALFATAADEMAEHSPIRGLPGRVFSRLAPPAMATLNRIPELVQKSRTAGSDLSFVVTKRAAFGSDVPASYVEFMSEMLGQTPLEVVADFYPAFAELDEYEAFDVLRRVETAVIGGEDDIITPVHHTDKIIEALPDADVRRLANCGHMGIIEHAGAFNEVLDSLIARVRESL
jgi:pimeloyl-ACP methyl ester carboxylesterase